MTNTFKILYPHALEKELKKEGPLRRVIPWDLIKDHENQAQRNHSQSLQRLNERGGLDPVEMYAVINDLLWRDVKLSQRECLKWIDQKAKELEEKTDN